MEHCPGREELRAKYDEFKLRDCVEQAGRHCPGRGCDYMFFNRLQGAPPDEAFAMADNGVMVASVDSRPPGASQASSSTNVGEELTAEESRFDCPRCGGSFCLSCNNAYHAGRTCAQDAALKKAASGTSGDAELQQWAAREGAKQCPNCNNMVAKTDGCNAMTCRCGIVFCWLCVPPQQAEPRQCTSP
eukprot:SAG31_NODE_30_length_32545_cov_9.378999_33_plen_188_part_00